MLYMHDEITTNNNSHVYYTYLVIFNESIMTVDMKLYESRIDGVNIGDVQTLQSRNFDMLEVPSCKKLVLK